MESYDIHVKLKLSIALEHGIYGIMYETAYIHEHRLWNTQFYWHPKTFEELVTSIMPQWAEPRRHTVVFVCVLHVLFFHLFFYCTTAEN